ncbi:MAG TPA: hypothetical protein VGL40_10535 [Bacillota bacterium]
MANSAVDRAAPKETAEGQRADAQLRGLCREFESFFLSALLKQANVFKPGVTAADPSATFADELAKAGGLGLGDSLYQFLKSGWAQSV